MEERWFFVTAVLQPCHLPNRRPAHTEVQATSIGGLSDSWLALRSCNFQPYRLISRWASPIWWQYLCTSIHSTCGALDLRVALISALKSQDVLFEERFLRNQFCTSRAYVCWSHQVGALARRFASNQCLIVVDAHMLSHCYAISCNVHWTHWRRLFRMIPVAHFPTTAGILRCGSFRKSAKTSFLPSQFWQKQASSLSTPTVIVSCHVMFRAPAVDLLEEAESTSRCDAPPRKPSWPSHRRTFCSIPKDGFVKVLEVGFRPKLRRIRQVSTKHQIALDKWYF